MKSLRILFYYIAGLAIFCLVTINNRAHALDDTDNQETIALLTSAPWKVSGDAKGWVRTRTFKKTGSFTTQEDPKETGHWKISDNMIILTFADKHQDTIALPLDPKGVRGTSASGEPMTCVLVKPAEKSTPTPTPDMLSSLSMGEMTDQEKATTINSLASAPWKESGNENGGWSRVRVFNRLGTFQTQEKTDEYGRWRISVGRLSWIFRMVIGIRYRFRLILRAHMGPTLPARQSPLH